MRKSDLLTPAINSSSSTFGGRQQPGNMSRADLSPKNRIPPPIFRGIKLSKFVDAEEKSARDTYGQLAGIRPVFGSDIKTSFGTEINTRWTIVLGGWRLKKTLLDPYSEDGKRGAWWCFFSCSFPCLVKSFSGSPATTTMVGGASFCQNADTHFCGEIERWSSV